MAVGMGEDRNPNSHTLMLQSRADSDNISVGEKTLKTGESQRTGSIPCSQHQDYNSQSNAGELTMVHKTGKSWQATKPCNYPGLEPGLCVLLKHRVGELVL